MSGRNMFVVKLARAIGVTMVVIVMLLTISACSKPDSGKAGSTDQGVAAESPKSLSPKSLSKEQALADRVRTYWDGRRDLDLLTTYKMEAQSLPGGTLTPKKYFSASGGSAALISYEVLATEISGDTAVVQIKTTNRLEIMGASHPMVNEYDTRWSWIDGQWYHGARAGGN